LLALGFLTSRLPCFCPFAMSLFPL
jgi:hypothetical protein